MLGCLIEKRFTTPEQYPLTLNALRLACNQSTNRDPVVDYDEETVRDAAQRLSKYGLARLASGHTSRATKYRHLADEALALGREQLAVLSVLLLRGAQTPGELKVRTERIVDWDSLAAVELVLSELIERELRAAAGAPSRTEGGALHASVRGPEHGGRGAGRPADGGANARRRQSRQSAGRSAGGGRDLVTRLDELERRVEQLAELVERAPKWVGRDRPRR